MVASLTGKVPQWLCKRPRKCKTDPWLKLNWGVDQFVYSVDKLQKPRAWHPLPKRPLLVSRRLCFSIKCPFTCFAHPDTTSEFALITFLHFYEMKNQLGVPVIPTTLDHLYNSDTAECRTPGRPLILQGNLATSSPVFLGRMGKAALKVSFFQGNYMQWFGFLIRKVALFQGWAGLMGSRWWQIPPHETAINSFRWDKACQSLYIRYLTIMVMVFTFRIDILIREKWLAVFS